MNIQLDANSVNEYVSQAIIKSALGAELEKSLNKAIGDVLHGYRSPVEQMVTMFIRAQIQQILDRDYAETIMQRVAEQLTAEKIKEVCDLSVKEILSKLDRY